MSRDTSLSNHNGSPVTAVPAAAEDATALIALEIERTRGRMVRTMTRLRSEVAEAVDWRTHYERRPWLFVAAAFGLGLWLGGRSAPSSARRLAS